MHLTVYRHFHKYTHTYSERTQRCPETNHPNRWCLISFSGYIPAPFAISTLVCVCAGGWLVIHVYLLKGGGRGHFPCHTTLILPLNHLAVSLTSPQTHTPPAPVPGNQEGKWWNTNNVCCERKSKRGSVRTAKTVERDRGSENEKRGWRMCGGRGEVLMTGVSVNSSSCIDC